MMWTASIVLYKTNISDFEKVLNSVELNGNEKLFLIDNSPTDELRIYQKETIDYFHNPSNPGFGSSHNIAIQKAIDAGAKYHFIINPDVFFNKDVISSMITYIENNKTVGMMMPQILNLNGSVQNLPKLLPSPISVLWRKLKKPKMSYQKFINRYELRNVSEKIIYNAPVLSGCFTLLNLEAIKKVGFYDDKYFMYFEDWDLSRRIHKHYKTIYFPLVSVYHGYESGANKNGKLFKIFIKSAITYFTKWGWFFDSERSKINNKALSQFE
jgi:GT2 family glycosyltransferase